MLRGKPLNTIPQENQSVLTFISSLQSKGLTGIHTSFPYSMDYTPSTRITKEEQEKLREFYDRVLKFGSVNKDNPYVRSTWAKMRIMIKDECYNSWQVVKEMKQIIKFMNCLKINQPETTEVAEQFIEEANSYLVFFKLAYV